MTIATTSLVVVSGSATDLVELRVNGHYFAEPATVQITIKDVRGVAVQDLEVMGSPR